MNLEYLIFNISVFIFPFFFSFDTKVNFISKWKNAFTTILYIMIPFIIWDILVTGRHWWFNDKYIFPLRIVGLPVEEWLFFITVPFSCLFIWEVINTYVKEKQLLLNNLKIVIILFLIPVGIFYIWTGTEYTGLSLLSLGIVAVFDYWFKTDIFIRRNTYLLLILVTILILIFNGYLTARPIVMYNQTYLSGLYIMTIPLEDFGYGFALILLNIILFEKLKRRGHE